jgi:hypothetical protein
MRISPGQAEGPPTRRAFRGVLQVQCSGLRLDEATAVLVLGRLVGVDVGGPCAKRADRGLLPSAAGVTMVASPRADIINGTNVHVDAGISPAIT